MLDFETSCVSNYKSHRAASWSIASYISYHGPLPQQQSVNIFLA